jgi:hypothetical protein
LIMTSQTFGDNEQRSGERCEYLMLEFSPLSAPLQSRWRNNGLSADFLGDYVTTFLPANRDIAAAGSRQSEIRHAVAYIANELLENAMKYHQRGIDIPIGIRMELSAENITVTVSNSVGFEGAQIYKSYVEGVLKEDPNDLLVRQLENSSAGEESNKSGVGLLTMVNDYGAKLGWRFDVHAGHSEIMTVTTRAVLPLEYHPGESA